MENGLAVTKRELEVTKYSRILSVDLAVLVCRSIGLV